MSSFLLGPDERSARVARLLAALDSAAFLHRLRNPSELEGLTAESGRLVLDIASLRAVEPPGEDCPEDSEDPLQEPSRADDGVWDIGTLRRFLKHRPHWTVVLVCEPPADSPRDRVDPADLPLPRDLLEHERVQVLRWPPRVEALQELLLPPPVRAAEPEAPAPVRFRRAAPAEEPSPAPEPPRADPLDPDGVLVPRPRQALEEGHVRGYQPTWAAAVRRLDRALQALRAAHERGDDPALALEAAETANRELLAAADRRSHRAVAAGARAFDLHRLVEEAIASWLVVEGNPRVRFRSQGDLYLSGRRARMRDALGRLLELAAECAGPGTLVELRATGTGLLAPVSLTVDFAAGALAGLPPREALVRSRLLERVGLVAADAGSRAAAGLRDAGARLGVEVRRGNRLTLSIELPRDPLGQLTRLDTVRAAGRDDPSAELLGI